jgi:hypothetical protein
MFDYERRPLASGWDPSVALPFQGFGKAVTRSIVVATESKRSTDPYLPANSVDRDQRRPCRPAFIEARP